METAVTIDLPGSPAVAAPCSLFDDFDSVVEQYWPRIYRYACAAVRDPDEAQTIAQDCFVRAYRARAQFRGESGLATWLIQIAVNLVRDRARSRRLQFWKRAAARSVEAGEAGHWLSDHAPTPEAQASARQQVAVVRKAVDYLSERQRTVFLLRFVEGMDLAEIASATGMKEGTVKAHLFRALGAVRRRVGAIR
jgi:RNA polymerase sigma-70 factor (ECF subfamily)